MDGIARLPKRDPRLGGAPITSTTGYPWVDGDILYAADLNAAFLPLTTGGNVVGATSVFLDLTTLPPFANATTFLATLHASGSTPGFSIAAQSTLTSTGGTTQAKRFDNPTISFWSTAIKYLPPGGLPAGMTQLQDQWTYIGNNIDSSNQPSSVGGALINEFDMAANNFCDGTTNSSPRSGAVYVFGTAWPVGPPPPPTNPAYGPPPLTGGWPAAYSSGMSFSIALNTVVHIGIEMAVQYSTSLWDSRNAVLHSGTIQTAASAGATAIHVSNVVGYSSWGAGAAPVSSSNPMPVTIGANTYNVIGAAFDAPGSGGVTTTLGTITLSSGIIGTDGASGNSVVQQARTIWLADGQQLCFSSGGDSYLHAIGNALFINATNFVEVSNGLQVGGGLSTGGNIQSLGSMQIGSTTAPASSALEFHSSGHTTADVTLTTSGGSSTANSGTLTIAAAYTAFSPLPTNAANDGAAATAGVPVGGVYRNGSALQIRVA